MVEIHEYAVNRDYESFWELGIATERPKLFSLRFFEPPVTINSESAQQNNCFDSVMLRACWRSPCAAAVVGVHILYLVQPGLLRVAEMLYE